MFGVIKYKENAGDSRNNCSYLQRISKIIKEFKDEDAKRSDFVKMCTDSYNYKKINILDDADH